MKWDIEYQKEHGIVYARLTGIGTDELLQQSADECVAIANKNDSNKFLVDERDLTYSTSISNIYDSAEGMKGISRTNKVAFVYSESPSNKNDYRFFETVSRNRGYNVRVFENQQKAMAWLINDE